MSECKMPVRLNRGDKVGLVCCSDGLRPSERERIGELKNRLEGMGLMPVESPFLYRRDGIFSGTGAERAGALMDFYKDETVRAIFDLSGGNIANEVLCFLDFDQIGKTEKMFFGYSDLTVLLNAILTKTGHCSGLYQVKNLLGSYGESQMKDFEKTILEGQENLIQFESCFLQGNGMEGIVAGGNLRCFLKLAGTPFWPDMTGRILFLESNGGEVGQMVTLISQLRQMGVFERVSGILLGTFSTMERENCVPTVEEILLEAVGPDVPVAKTQNIGHRSDSKCLVIGSYIKL